MTPDPAVELDPTSADPTAAAPTAADPTHADGATADRAGAALSEDPVGPSGTDRHEPAPGAGTRGDGAPGDGAPLGTSPDDAPHGSPQSAERWRLEDQADFYRRSLADAEVEHEAGDLADDDYQALVRRDRRRLADVEAELERLDRATEAREPDGATGRPDGVPAPAGRHGRRRHRRAFLVVGLVALAAAGSIVLILHLIAPSLPGQPFSGSTTVNLAKTIQLQLTQAGQMVADGNLTGALGVYQEILGEEPHQAAALTERGWLEYAAGVQTGSARLIAQGRASIQEAQSVAPDEAPAHLLLGIIALQQDNDATAAVAQFTKFLADHPSASNLAQGAPYIRRAYALAGLPVPAQVPAASG